jgi:hypothetical protein
MTNQQKLIFVLCLFLAGWGCFLLFTYRSLFGGDPEIHLIFAKHLLAGHWLEFNEGWKSGGETSPLYMVITSLFVYLAGDHAQYLMKAQGVLSLAAIMSMLYRADVTAKKSERICLILLFSCMAFIPFQAMLGMENFLFAAIVTFIVHRYYSNNALPNLILSPLLVLIFFLRPEGVLVALWLFLKGLFPKRNNRLLFTAAISILLIVVLYVLLNKLSGVNVQNAGMIRALTSKAASISVNFGPLVFYINTKPLIGFSYAFPILLLLFINRRDLNKDDYLTLGMLVALPLVLHTFNIFPNTHFSRYFLYPYAILFYVFSSKVLRRIGSGKLILLSFCILGISFFEFYKRKELGQMGVDESIAQFQVPFIKSFSDSMYDNLNTGSLPITIANQEVQIRGVLDERFLVWSLDGITDADLAKFIHKDYIDHFAYIKYRKINYIQGLPNYNINKNRKSLADFIFDDNGRSQCIDEIFLTKTTYPDIYKINSCRE